MTSELTRLPQLRVREVETSSEMRAIVSPKDSIFCTCHHETRSGYWQEIKVYVLDGTVLVNITRPVGAELGGIMPSNDTSFVLRRRGGDPAIVALVQDLSMWLFKDPMQLEARLL